jgi:hypothetical protein
MGQEQEIGGKGYHQEVIGYVILMTARGFFQRYTTLVLNRRKKIQMSMQFSTVRYGRAPLTFMYPPAIHVHNLRK